MTGRRNYFGDTEYMDAIQEAARAAGPRWTADPLLEVTDGMLFVVVKEFRRLGVKVPPHAYLRQALQAAMKVKRAEWPRRGNG